MPLRCQYSPLTMSLQEVPLTDEHQKTLQSIIAELGGLGERE